MFTPVPMQYMKLFLPRDQVQSAALVLAREGIFDPQVAEMEDTLPERPAGEYGELLRSVERRLHKTIDYLDIPFPEAPKELRVVSSDELHELGDELARIWQQCSATEEQRRSQEEEQRRLDQLRSSLRHYEALDIDLGLLQDGLQFLDLRIGTVPVDHVARLRRAVSLEGYSLTVYLRSDKTAHVVVAGLARGEERLHDVLRAASFRALELPPEFHDRPAKVRQDLVDRAQALEEEGNKLQQQVADLKRRHLEALTRAAQTVMLAAPFAALGDAVASRGRLAQIQGWVPSDRQEYVCTALERALPGKVVLEVRDPTPEEWPQVPSLLRYPRWLRGFGRLVRNYGVPRYGEVDPTWLLTLTFVLMYGMMFGDVGHGLVIAAGGWLLRRHLRGYSPFAIASGLASTGFGFVYGSIFGYEAWVEPLWRSPLAAPATLLQLALVWGAIFIVGATAITVRNRLIQGERGAALMDGTGVAGLLFYLAGIFIAYRILTQGTVHPAWLLGLLAPLTVVFAFQWSSTQGWSAERALVALIGTLEVGIRYLANTLSFLRVAAFSLNHAALAFAVFTIAELTSGAAQAAIVVLGNLVILVLEGAIVAIQALRLEYYEGFSRFFSGDGRPYHPLILSPEGRAL